MIGIGQGIRVTGMQMGSHNCHKCCAESTTDKGQWEQKAECLNLLREVGIVVGGISAGVGNRFSGKAKTNKKPTSFVKAWRHVSRPANNLDSFGLDG